MTTRTAEYTDTASGLTYTATFSFEDFEAGCSMFAERGTSMGWESTAVDGREVEMDELPPCVLQHFAAMTTADFDLSRPSLAHDFD